MKKTLIVIAAAMLTFGIAGIAGAVESTEGTDAEGNDNNQVTCENDTAASSTDVAGFGQINSGGDATSGGYAELCADETHPNAVAQGSIYAEGDTSGGSIAADGDADNPTPESQGWAKITVGTDGTATVTCGDDPAENPTGDFNSRDGGGSQANCG